MSGRPVLRLGSWRSIAGEAQGPVLGLPAHHLVTHGVIVGMTMPMTLCPTFPSG